MAQGGILFLFPSFESAFLVLHEGKYLIASAPQPEHPGKRLVPG